MPAAPDPVPRGTSGPGPGRAPTDVRRMFDGIAPRYDLLNRLLSAGMDRGWRRQAVVAATAARPGRILDVATGTGDLALALKRARPEARVTGVDFAEGMLRIARRKARRAGADLSLAVADGTALPYPDASFDALTIAYGLRNFADVDAGLREFRRVLIPGGRLVVLEFPPPPDGPFGRVFRAYFTRILPWVGGRVSGDGAAYAYLPASVLTFPDPEALARRMEHAGFDHVTWTPQTFGISALHVGVVPPTGGASPAGGIAGHEEEPA